MSNSRARVFDVISVVCLIAVAVIWRYMVWSSHLAGLTNVELITVTTVFAGVMLRSRFSWIIPLAAVALSDTLIPNSRTTMLYVWSAWLVIGLGNQYFSSKRAFVSKTGSKNNRIAGAVALGGLVLAAAFSGRIFSPIGHLLSPFSLIVLAALMVAAVLVLSRSFPKLALGLGLGIGSTLFFFAATNFGVWMEGWYPMTAQGLVTCYIRALPFLERQLRATVILVPAAILAGEAVVRVLAKSAVHSPVTHKV